jgi:hypothetical protein
MYSRGATSSRPRMGVFPEEVRKYRVDTPGKGGFPNVKIREVGRVADRGHQAVL